MRSYTERMRGRFAPSPTGEMHLGNARTALLAWLQVREAGGRLVLRIEDIDFTRVRENAEADILQDLRWLGLDWDEGPDVGGGFGPYRQSERLERYTRVLDRLETYPCTCTRKNLLEAVQAAPSAPHGAELRYPGTCAGGSGRSGVAPQAIRLRVPKGEFCFLDVLRGRVCQDVQEVVGDFVLRRGDGAFSYHLAVVTDDVQMQITHVLRGDDLLSSTARQVFLHGCLAVPAPMYCHVPLMTDHHGQRLAKRGGAPSLKALRQAGANPQTLVRELAQSLGWAVQRDCHPQDLLGQFQAWTQLRNAGGTKI